MAGVFNFDGKRHIVKVLTTHPYKKDEKKWEKTRKWEKMGVLTKFCIYHPDFDQKTHI